MSARRVLIVDGDTDSRTVCRTILQHHGYEVREAKDGSAALREARMAQYSVVLMELTLGEVDGHTLLEELRSDPGTAGSCIIVLTARAFEEDRARAERAGCSAFLAKPIKPLTLVARIEELLYGGERAAGGA